MWVILRLYRDNGSGAGEEIQAFPFAGSGAYLGKNGLLCTVLFS